VLSARCCLFCFTLLFPLLSVGCSEEGDADDGVRVPVTVMTRNLYLGSDLSSVVLANSLETLLDRSNVFWQAVQKSDIPARAKLLAAEIAAASPDLLGLQEVEMFRVQTPGDLNPLAPIINAEEVVYDFLTLLQSELVALGQSYSVAATNTLSDVEAPARGMDGSVYDIRMTDRDVILVKQGVAFANPVTRVFNKYVEIKLAGLASFPVQLKRGLSTIDVSIGGATVVFANVHLEVGGLLESFQRDQAREMVTLLAPRKEQILLVGDINSSADPEVGASFMDIDKSFNDAWPRLPTPVVAKTCCRELSGPPTGADGERIDVVLTRGPVTVLSGRLTGNDAVTRTASGLAASDHAGVVMQLGIKPAPAAKP
jgi:endonuclease/exonuclease/phosphatase family metal-dependent hydrolase